MSPPGRESNNGPEKHGQNREGRSYFALFKDRQVFGWAMYDWANSAFSTIVVSALLGPYLSSLAGAGQGPFLFSLRLKPDSIYPFFVSISVLMQLFVLPVIGAMGDMLRRKKALMMGFAVSGSILTCLLGASAVFLQGAPSSSKILCLGIIFVLANLFFGASITLYNSFLSDISSPSLRDRVSSLGWALGYIGGGLALALSMAFFFFLGKKEAAIQASFVVAGLWWLFFSILFTGRLLKEKEGGKRPLLGRDLFQKGFKEPFLTLFAMRRKRPDAWRFLVAYFFYNDGVQTVIAVASIFAVSVLKVDGMTLLGLILFIQFVAAFGAAFFGWLGESMGTKKAILLSLLVWMAITLLASFSLSDVRGLFALAFLIAMVLGGTQALSRSMFSMLVPCAREAEYFGFYEVSEKGSSWLGPLVFGLVVELTGDTRAAMLSIGVFFLLGFWVLLNHE